MLPNLESRHSPEIREKTVAREVAHLLRRARELLKTREFTQKASIALNVFLYYVPDLDEIIKEAQKDRDFYREIPIINQDLQRLMCGLLECILHSRHDPLFKEPGIIVSGEQDEMDREFQPNPTESAEIIKRFYQELHKDGMAPWVDANIKLQAEHPVTKDRLDNLIQAHIKLCEAQGHEYYIMGHGIPLCVFALGADYSDYTPLTTLEDLEKRDVKKYPELESDPEHGQILNESRRYWAKFDYRGLLPHHFVEIFGAVAGWNPQYPV